MDALVDDRIIDGTEIPEQIHLKIEHYDLAGDGHGDCFALFSIEHRRLSLDKIYLSEDECVFTDSLPFYRQSQAVCQCKRINAYRRLTVWRDFKCRRIMFL